MVTGMLEAVAVLGVIETLVLDFPAAPGDAEYFPAADPPTREVSEPERVEHLAVGLVLAVEDHPHRFPAERFPRVKVVGVPDFNPVLPLAEDLMGRLAEKPLLGGREQFGGIVFQTGDDEESQIADVVQEGGSGEFSIDDHVIGKTAASVADGAPEQSPTDAVLAIPRAVGFNIQGKGQAGSHHTDHSQFVVVADDLFLLVPVGEPTTGWDFSDERGRGAANCRKHGSKEGQLRLLGFARGTNGPFRGPRKHLALLTRLTIALGGGQVYVIGRAAGR